MVRLGNEKLLAKRLINITKMMFTGEGRNHNLFVEHVFNNVKKLFSEVASEAKNSKFNI